MTAVNPKWLLVDVYIDIASSKTGSSRKEFNRMLNDCKSRDIEIILSKSISRFGRDTVEVLEALNQLKVLGVPVIFDQEAINTADIDDELMISIIESIAQAENESRGDYIKWGIKQRAACRRQQSRWLLGPRATGKGPQSYIIENVMGILMMQMVIWQLMRKRRKMSD